MKKLSLLLVLAAAGCGSRAELEWPVTEAGQYRVGYREAHVIYEPGAGAKEGEPRRTLRIAVWYPTQATSGEKVKYLGLDRDDVLGNAEPIGEDLPLMLYSHGHLGFPEGTGYLCEYFASHGFVVVAPEHTGDTFAELTVPLSTEMFLLRPLDVKATLDWIFSDDVLTPKLSGEVFLSGHSFGGYTSFAVAGAEYVKDCAGTMEEAFCRAMTAERQARFKAGFFDERVLAIAALAPGSNSVLGPQGVAKIELPVLLASGGLDQQVAAPEFWTSLDGEEDRWLDIPRAGHHTFSLTCDVLPGFGEDDGCGDDAIPPAEAYGLINAYVLAFARLHLFGDESVRAIVDGETSLSSELRISRK